MMNVLFTFVPFYGHLHSMVPLARALAEHGHQVAFATGASFGPVVDRLGFTHFPCGLDHDGGRSFDQIKSQGVAGQNGKQGGDLFADPMALRMADDLLELVQTWKPDLFVRDPVEFGAYIAAELLEIPHANIEWGYHLGEHLRWKDDLVRIRRSYGLAEDRGLGSLYRYLSISFMPPSWVTDWDSVPSVAHWFQVSPFDRSGAEGLPSWADTLPDRPTVYATLGTTYNQAPQTFQAILDALRDEKINVIVTVGRNMDPTQFGPQPEHIHIERYIPQTLVLPRCDAVIGHGGYNTLISALSLGLPMVLIPLNKSDQPRNSRRCEEMGAGILVEGTPPAPEAIRMAVRSVLSSPEYRMQAERLQTEISNLPDLDSAVKVLERLARSMEPQVNHR